jgi:hypothetical protein
LFQIRFTRTDKKHVPDQTWLARLHGPIIGC